MTYGIDRGSRTDARQRRNAQTNPLPYRPTPSKTAAYRAAYYDMVLCDPSGAGFTVSLPPATDRTGAWIGVKNTTSSTNTITLDADGTETIDGVGTYAISTAYRSVTVFSDGANWHVI